MKYCKKCGVLYTTEVCPKCGIVYPDKEQKENGGAPEADKKLILRQWLGIIVGVPLLILAIWAVINLIY